MTRKLLLRNSLRCPNCNSLPEVIRMSESNADEFWWTACGVTYSVLLQHESVSGHHCPNRYQIYHNTVSQAADVLEREMLGQVKS